MINRLLAIVTIFLFSATTHASSDVQEILDRSAKKERKILIVKEFARRNVELEASKFISLCDDKSHQEWCDGFFSATISTLNENDKNECIPRNDVNRHIFDGVWTIIKSWLYRQPKHSKTTFSNAVLRSLSETEKC
jgi:hypothetical protein